MGRSELLIIQDKTHTHAHTHTHTHTNTHTHTHTHTGLLISLKMAEVYISEEGYVQLTELA